MNRLIWSAALCTGVFLGGCTRVEREMAPCQRGVTLLQRDCRFTGNEQLREEDEVFARRILENAAPLCDGGKAGKATELAKQLERTDFKADLQLAAPRETAYTPAELYEQRLKSIYVLAEIYKCKRCTEWHFRGSGTAFPLSEDGIFASARHLLEDEQEDRVLIADSEANVYPVTEVLASSAPDDLVVFRVEGHEFKPLPLRSGAPIGTDVFMISHPGSCFYLLTRGMIARNGHHARLRNSAASKRAQETTTPSMDITAEFGNGSSGAPVLDAAGNVLGIASQCQLVRFSEELPLPQMWVRTCIPTGQLLKLLKMAPEEKK